MYGQICGSYPNPIKRKVIALDSTVNNSSGDEETSESYKSPSVIFKKNRYPERNFAMKILFIIFNFNLVNEP